MSGSTEDNILNTIPDFQDGGGDSDVGGHDSGGDATTSAQPSGDSGATTSAQPGSDAGTQQQQVRRRHDGLVEVPNPEQPNTRDLVDPITGRTVARGGIERRVFEDGQRHARENNQLKQQLSNASRQLASINEVTQEAVRLNVAPQDQVVAIRVMAEFMRDPVKTLESLVAEVKSKGYSIPFLEQGVTPGMDMAAIQRMIEAKMAPLTNAEQQMRQQQHARQQAQGELDGFLAENQDANSNLDVLAEMLQAQPGLSLQSAYTKMIRWSHENGLDWTIPLKQQIAQRQQSTRVDQQPTQQPEQRQTRPLPNGRSASTGAQSVNGSAGGQQFNENASWAEIIRQSMQENGVNFS